MRSRPPGSKSATVEDTEEWDAVVFGTSDLAENYGKYDSIDDATYNYEDDSIHSSRQVWVLYLHPFWSRKYCSSTMVCMMQVDACRICTSRCFYGSCNNLFYVIVFVEP